MSQDNNHQAVAINPDEWGAAPSTAPAAPQTAQAQPHMAQDINPDEWGNAGPSPASQPRSNIDRLANPDLVFGQPAQPADSVDALRRGGMQGATYGFGEEGKAALQDPTFGDKYRSIRDSERASNEAAHNAHPWLYNLAQLAGGAAPFAIAPELLAGAGGAAALGALGGLGNSNADLTKGEAGRSAVDTGLGGLGGYAGAKILPPLFKKAGETLSDWSPAALKAAYKAVAAHLRPTPQMRQKVGDAGMDEISQRVLDTGAIESGTKVKNTHSNIEALMDIVGKDKGDLLANSGVKINPHDVAEQFTKEVIDPLMAVAETKAAGRAMIRKRDEFLDHYAPGSKYGGRPMGSPTVITRTPKYVWKDAPVEQGMSDIGVKATPRTYVDVATTPDEANQSARYGMKQTPGKYFFSVGPDGEQHLSELPTREPKVEKQLRIFSLGDELNPVTHYSTPERIPELASVTRKRLEAVPQSEMTPVQLDANKRATQAGNNYQAVTDLQKQRQGGTKGWASVQRQQVEKAVPEVKYPNELYGNLADAEKMSSRTRALTGDGNGLLGHLTDLGAANTALQEIMHGNMRGATLALARLVSKGRLSSTAAVGLSKLSQLMAAAPGAAQNATPYLKGAAGVSAPLWTKMLQSNQGGER